jgi:hypothetical protein
MHHTDARHDGRDSVSRHPAERASALRAFWIMAALIIGCGSSDDVVGEVEPIAAPPRVGGIMTFNGTFVPVNTGAGVPAVGGSSAATPNATAPGAVAPGAPTPLLPRPPGAPAVAGALSVSGAPRAEPGGSPQRWPFLEPLSLVFGVPDPGAPSVTIQVTDPLAKQMLRELGGEDGSSPIIDPVLITVVDAIDDRYDLAIWDGE